MDTFINWLDIFQEFLWGYVGIFLISSLGLYFTVKSRFIQFSGLVEAVRYVISSSNNEYAPNEVSPARAFFASLGGCVGVGNIVVVCYAIKHGGPGVLFWMWVVAFFGSMLKYAEIYLGLTFREKNEEGRYVGGPMYFLQKAFPAMRWVAYLMAFFMCIYGIEVVMFKSIQDTFVQNFDLDSKVVAFSLLALILFGVRGGIKSVGSINSYLISGFICIFLSVTFWVLLENSHLLWDSLCLVFSSAFNGHAMLGGFVGATAFAAMSNAISAASYSGDVAIGYESIMHSSASVIDSKKHARLSILNIFLDTFVVCTCTALIVIVTEVWTSEVEPVGMLQSALELYIPHMNYLMPIFIFMLAYSTIISYFVAGLGCAKFISPKYGALIFYIAAISGFILFSFHSAKSATVLMYSAGGCLLVINSLGIFKLRKHVKF